MATSVIAAVIEYYESLSFPGKPTPLWFDQAPLRDSTGAVQVPYVVLHDDGLSPEYDFEHNVSFEKTEIRFEVYGLTLASVDGVVKGIKYNGGGVASGIGFDYANPSGFPYAGSPGDWILKDLERTNERRFQEPDRSHNANLVFRCTISYTVTVGPV